MAGRNRVNVKVVPDTTGFAKKLKADLNRIEKGLKVKVKVEVDTRLVRQQIQKAARDQTATINVRVNDRGSARQMAAAIEKASPQVNKAAAKSGNRAGTQFGRGLARGLTRVRIDRTIVERAGFALGRSLTGPIIMLTKFAGAATLATAALGPLMGAVGPLVFGVTGLASALITASGALLALPAMAGAAAASIATLVVGMKGFGEALKAESSADFEKAIADMTPAARGAARAFRALKPAFSEIRQVTQQNLFKGLSTQIKGMSTNLLPALKRGMGSLASGLNKQIGAVFKRINTKAFSKDLEGSFKNFGKAAENAAPAMANLVDIFGQLMKVGSELLPDMGKGLTEMTDGWLKSIKEQRKSGELLDKMKNGFEAIKSLGRSIKNIFSGVGNVLKIAEKSGGGFLKNLEKGSKAFEKFTESAEGEKTLTSIFDALKEASTAMAPVFKQIATSFGDIAPVLADIVKEIAPVLKRIVKVFGDTFKKIGPDIGKSLADIGDIIADILPPLMQLVPPFLQLVVSVFKPLVPVVQTLAPILGHIASALASILDAVGPLVVPLGAVAASLALIKRRAALGGGGLTGFLLGGKRGAKGIQDAAKGTGVIATNLDKASKAGRGARFAKGGLVGLALGMTGSENIAKMVDEATGAIGQVIDAGTDGWKGLAAVLSDNQEALDNIRSKYWDLGDNISNFVTGSDNMRDSINKLTDALPGKKDVTWLENLFGGVHADLQKTMELAPLLDAALGMEGATDSLTNLGIPLDVLNRALSRGLVDAPKVVDAITTIEAAAQGMDIKPEKVQEAREYLKRIFGDIENDMKSAFSRGMQAVDNITAQLPKKVPPHIRTGMNAGLKIMNSGWGGMLDVALDGAKKASNAGKKFKPAPHFRKGTNDAKKATRNGMKGVEDEVRNGSSRAASAASDFASKLASYFNVDLSGKGAAMMNSLAIGIRGAMSGPAGAMAEAMSLIAGYMQNSPAKWGPFSGRGYTLIRGQITMDDFATGIKNATPHVTDATARAMSATADTFKKVDGARGAGAEWATTYADGIESQARRVGNTIATLAAPNTDFNATVDQSVEFASLEDKVARALEGWSVDIDHRGVGRMANKYERNRRRR